MDRYIAFVWDTSNRSAGSDAARYRQVFPPPWRDVLSVSGLCVMGLPGRCPGIVASRLHDAEGVVLGPLFERGKESAGRVRQLTPALSHRVLASRADPLIGAYWGSYIAFWRIPSDGSIGVMRDPGGGLPCFRTRRGDVDIIFSHPEDLVALNGNPPAIDWRFLHAYLANNASITAHTGLEEVSELMPGQRLLWRPGATETLDWAWNGADIAAEPDLRPFDEAVVQVRETFQSCLNAFSAEYRSFLVRLSGGLDSSIVLNLLRSTTGGAMTAVHLVGSDYEAHERALARLAARQAGVALEEIAMTPGDVDLRTLLTLPPTARPTKQVLGRHVEAILRRHCEAEAVDCVIGGHGGDAVFLQTALAVHNFTDFVQLNGCGPGMLPAAYDAAVLKQTSVAAILRARFTAAGSRREAFPRRHNPLVVDARDGAPAYATHPWLAASDHLPKGKTGQLRSLVALRDYHSILGMGDNRDVVMPYAAQPMLECALRTPTYILGWGGEDRALQRAAFGDIIPSQIRQRTSKGFINHHLLRVLEANSGFLREFVVDGILASTGVLDRDRAALALSRERLMRGEGLGSLLSVVVVEAWLRTWQGLGARV